jgi:hypothetical protein
MVGESVTRVRPVQSGTDRYGVPVYTDSTVVLEERAAFDPGGSREPVEVGRAPVVTNPKLYFRGAIPDLKATDRLIIRGRTYTVQGDPAYWKSPYGSEMSGLVVELQATEG